MSRPCGSSGDRPAALFLAPEAPYPPVGGGALRSAALLEYLARRYDVDVLVFREPGSADPAAAFPPGLVRRAGTIDLTRHSRGIAARTVRNALRLVRSAPPLWDRFGGYGDSVRAFAGGRRYEIGILEHFWCASYLAQLAPQCAHVALDLHNLESVLHDGCARTEPWPLGAAHHRFRDASGRLERRWLPQFPRLLVASQDDARRARRIAPDSDILVYPNTIPRVPQPAAPEENAIVFSGNLEYHPNAAAVRFFRREIWPRLRERWPDLVWRLVGRDSASVLKWVKGDARIEVLGPVPDAVTELAKARAAVAPILAGSGTRVKIIEAWAAGRAVVSTTLGAEGLRGRHGEHLLLADCAEDFASAVSSLLGDAELRARIGRAGRRLYEEAYTWEAGWEILDRAGL